MKQKINQLFLVAALLCGAMSMTSCQGLIDAIVGEHADNSTQPTPQPTPEPTPQPKTIVKATDLLKEAQKEGAIVVFWYHYEGDLHHVIFKKVGDEYVRQNSVAGTRADNDEENTELIETLDINQEKLIFNIDSNDNGGWIIPVLEDVIDTSTGEMKQKTSSSTTHMSAMTVPTPLYDIKSEGSVNFPYISDIEGYDHVILPKVYEKVCLLQSILEINADAIKYNISPDKALEATVNNYQLKVAEDWENGTSKITKIDFPDLSPSVTWSPTASENHYKQALKTEGEGTVVYNISPDNENTCKAEINTSTGEVTFEKPGKVTVKATFTDNDGFDDTAIYILTVNKAEGSISFATASLDKVTTDAAFTNTLTKTGDGSVTYTSDNESVAKVNSSTGEVTIVGAGEATIKATVEDSETYTYATKTATYKLTVTGVNSSIGEAVGYEWGGDLSSN